MLLDGHSAASVVSNLRLSSASFLSGWKTKMLEESGSAAEDHAIYFESHRPSCGLFLLTASGVK